MKLQKLLYDFNIVEIYWTDYKEALQVDNVVGNEFMATPNYDKPALIPDSLSYLKS